MMTQVIFDGELGNRFGKVWDIDLDRPSPAQALKALCRICKGLRNYLRENAQTEYHVFTGTRDIGESDLFLPSGKKEIRFMPALAGAKSAGVLQIIVGAVLIIAGAVYGYFTGDWVHGGQLMTAGVAMMVGGVAQLLFAPADPSKQNTEKPENTASYLFNGPINTTGQGNCAAVCYGEVETGSQVISAGIYTEEYVPPGTDPDGDGYRSGGGIKGKYYQYLSADEG
jgi:predicted phage tail protein